MSLDNAQQEIIPIDIEEEVKGSYIDYAMSTIVGRALPDVRDGLKPVHRRILFAMNEMGNVWNKPYKKCARVVGDVMGKYHPHGDQAIYDALVRMAQNFSMRAMLVDGQGNFGSIDGDEPAAMRYTEARMSKISSELLADIDEETVDFMPNYDNTMFEPLCMPAKFPNLLVNGSGGIAVGMATNMPPHNLGEVIDGTLLLIQNPKATIAEISRVITGPDFPTGAYILGKSGIREAYETGRGIVIMRAKLHFEPTNKGGRDKIVVTEIPYQVNKTTLIEHIAALAQEGRLKEIADLRDESDREGMRVVIEVKRGENLQVTANKLYKLTNLQASFGIINLAIKEGKPKVMNIKELIEAFIDHRKQVIIRRTRFRLKKAQERAHILEGLKIALDNIELVISIIRSSKDTNAAKDALITRLALSEVQAKAILDMRLARLTSLETEKILAELAEVLKMIAYYEQVLGNMRLVLEIISQELSEIRRDYADARRTEILSTEDELSIEDIVADDEMVVSITRDGYVKRVPISVYRAQKRGGRGVTALSTKAEDFIDNLFVASNHDIMLFFTRKGMVYARKVYDLPEASRTSKGTAIVNLLQINSEDSIAATVAVRDFSADKCIFFCTRKGYVKQTLLSAFANARTKGVVAIEIPDDDELIECMLTKATKTAAATDDESNIEEVTENLDLLAEVEAPEEENGDKIPEDDAAKCEGEFDENILIATRNGISIRFPAAKVRQMGRTARGVIGIRLEDRDEVVAMAVITNNADAILFVSENGFGKRTRNAEFRCQSRGGKGIIAMRVTHKTGPVVGAVEVTDGDHIVLVNSDGILIRIKSAEISEIGRATQGVRLISLLPGQTLRDVAKSVEGEDDEEIASDAAEIGTDDEETAAYSAEEVAEVHKTYRGHVDDEVIEDE